MVCISSDLWRLAASRRPVSALPQGPCMAKDGQACSVSHRGERRYSPRPSVEHCADQPSEVESVKTIDVIVLIAWRGHGGAGKGRIAAG